jgi:hypothetical protein
MEPPMPLSDHPLLNDPNLSALILHAAADGPADLDVLLRRLHALLQTAQEPTDVPEAELRRHLRSLCGDLATARLLAPEGDAFILTNRGRQALADHPSGLARADLAQWPEYAEAVRERAEGPGTSEPQIAPGHFPHPEAYENGASARIAERPLTDNPHPADTADHVAWSYGWGDAQDR